MDAFSWPENRMPLEIEKLKGRVAGLPVMWQPTAPVKFARPNFAPLTFAKSKTA